jgi:excisionase family DNA binding protein
LPLSQPQTKLLLTVEEAARQLSIGRPKMYQLVMRGDIVSVKIGASRRIPVAALNEYVQRLTEDTTGVARGVLAVERREEHG